MRMRSPAVSGFVSTLRRAPSRKRAGEKNGPTVCEPVRGNVLMILPLLTLVTQVSRMAWHAVHAQQCPSDSLAPTPARSGHGRKQQSGVYAPALSAMIA